MDELETTETQMPASVVKALTAIVELLIPLSPEQRTSVLRGAIAFLSIGSDETSYRSAFSGSGVFRTMQPQVTSPAFSEDRTQSPKDFLKEKQPVTDIDRVACLAYYLAHYRDTPHFKTLDISKLNTEAAQLKLSNAAATVENATRVGILVPAAKGAKQISTVGELYVQALPDRTAAREVLATTRARRRGKKPRTGNTAEANRSDSEATEDEN